MRRKMERGAKSLIRAFVTQPVSRFDPLGVFYRPNLKRTGFLKPNFPYICPKATGYVASRYRVVARNLNLTANLTVFVTHPL